MFQLLDSSSFIFQRRTETCALATGSSSGLNQYASRDVPDVIDVLGFSLYDDTQSDLDINGMPAQHRREEYFYHQLDNLGNSTGDLYEQVEVAESMGGTPIAEESGYYFVAEDPEEFEYDDDGNLLSDGRWEYTWDGENRLIEVEEVRTQGLNEINLRKLNFVYDDQGRRIETKEWAWIDSHQLWINYRTVRFLYSGFNVIAELNQSLTTQKTYLWGLDEGEMNDYRNTGGWSSIGRAAGGVGGLLLVRDHNQNEAHFVHSDGNGNVVALLDADGNGEISAIYDYDPFGNLIRVTGEAAELNPFRFSTKYQDNFTDLYYYGFRFYSPGQGRFLNRDPIEEEGGLNLYGFVGNDPVNRGDFLGLYDLNFVYPAHNIWFISMSDRRWSPGQIRDVEAIQMRANSGAITFALQLERYQSEIPVLYCPTAGRTELKSVTNQAIDALWKASAGLSSLSKRLDVSKANDSGAALAFVHWAWSDRVWLNESGFFNLPFQAQSGTFLHEIVDLEAGVTGRNRSNSSIYPIIAKTRDFPP